MSRYEGRKLPGPPSGSSGIGGFFSLGKQLASRRGLNRDAPKKIAPVKPSLTTSKQKAGEIEKIINKDFVPSGMQLVKLRQLAAQGKILNPKEARDFLHRSEAGRKLDTRESIQKYESELLKAELEATREAVNNPIKYKFREGGEAHINQKAKELVKGLYKESAEQAHAQAAETSKMDAIQERHARLATLHAALRPAPPAVAPTPGMRSGPMPTLQAVEPVSSPTASRPPTGSPLVAPPSGVGSHVPGAHTSVDESGVGLGMPVVVHHETPVQVAPISEPATPSMPAFQEPEPLDQPLPSHPTVPAESAPVSDAFGGSGDKE